ncbi:MAG TPA: acetyl-CoA carboxylase carboxyltransferase subunit alpha [Candidatus Merdibacter merdavium]|uniref:Acetyl-coenzyme A carboxylase carboxyl transferase subunit alpha n=1 Tax=Candidatus Merdibacter merdavium TaxID=2838692 RepID=A0A9D2NSR3_9FIRM|nr:acetyl-CoA carboxylase carboxyltransferase subunit alpha [Candidatus Merdibacter merdavium]
MSLMEKEQQLSQLQEQLAQCQDDAARRMQLEHEIKEMQEEMYQDLSAWDRVYLARHPRRPKAQDYLKRLFHTFYELHGDRCYGDDRAIIGGIAMFEQTPVTVIAQAKGRDLQENMKRNFGMPNPEGYRKALRLAKEAEKFHRPIITFVDTSGAYPGKGAEERGQAEAIAQCLYTFSDLQTPVICIVLSEGGSGGALALSVGDRLIMLENAIYSILSPEGFASILWKDGSRAKEAAEVMKLTAHDLMDKGILDAVIEEPLGGAQNDIEAVCERLRAYIHTALEELQKAKMPSLLAQRYEKYRSIGVI